MPVMASVTPFASCIPMPAQVPGVTSVVSPTALVSELHLDRRRVGYVRGLRNRRGHRRRDAYQRG
jgi:hypothetical protein